MKTALMITFMFLGQPYNIELAITPIEQATGLMYRQQWTDSSQGMLFINNAPRQVSFWMKNTYLNMIIYYLDKDFNILEIHYPIPLDETGITSKSDKVQYILEINPKFEKQITDSWDKFSQILKDQLIQKQPVIQKYQY
ncbi:MAG: DUF192 domain-containing protein [Brevinema sp.]